MTTSYRDQKEGERRILEAARKICSLFPPGEVEIFEEPDLRIKTVGGWLGVEVTELVRPNGENPFPPVEDENFHREVVRLAEEEYRRTHDAVPVCVVVYFLNEARCRHENLDGWLRLTDRKTGRKLEKMASSLVDFVKRHSAQRTGSTTFSKREMHGQTGGDVLPTGFEVIGITWPAGPWHSGESASIPPLDPQQLSTTIRKKNGLLPQYRAKVPDAPIWLLIYNGPSVSRGVPIPRSITEWKFAFDFDKVFLFSGMDNQIFDIGRL
jgi:hypothetical protein